MSSSAQVRSSARMAVRRWASWAKTAVYGRLMCNNNNNNIHINMNNDNNDNTNTTNNSVYCRFRPQEERVNLGTAKMSNYRYRAPKKWATSTSVLTQQRLESPIPTLCPTVALCLNEPNDEVEKSTRVGWDTWDTRIPVCGRSKRWRSACISLSMYIYIYIHIHT